MVSDIPADKAPFLAMSLLPTVRCKEAWLGIRYTQSGCCNTVNTEQISREVEAESTQWKDCFGSDRPRVNLHIARLPPLPVTATQLAKESVILFNVRCGHCLKRYSPTLVRRH